MRVESRRLKGTLFRIGLLLAFLLFSASAFQARAANLDGLTVIGVAPDGTETPISSYRWMVEEDKTYHVQTFPDGTADPSIFDPNWDQLNDGIPGGETLAVSFHRSYMPVVAKGCVGFGDVVDANPSDPCAADVLPDGGFDAGKNYYVSVVPRSGASIGGAVYVPGAGTTVYVNQHPIPAAQITIFIFEDNMPINNAPDMPQEDPAVNGGDMSGFSIIVEDAGGRYGASAGIQSQDAFGNPLGTTYNDAGEITGYEPLITGPDGTVTIRNLAPGKYGISAVPPAGQGWQQTTTIEGTKVMDAWVKANEPPFFTEFGPPGYHVFIGFVKEINNIPAGGGATISGTVVNQHMSRPPNYAFYNGACFGHTTPWVGLNDLSGGGIGTGIYTAATDADCNFSIPDVPDGNYQLVVWDNNLDLIFAFKAINIADGVCDTPDGSCNLGEVPVFQWFHRQEHRVFDDTNGNGTWDANEGPSALETGFSLRWRDGTVNQSNVSDGLGAFTFDQVFPFFSWLVAEVDFTRFQATGVTVVVDNGGPIPASAPGPAPLDDNDFTFGSALNPQDQTNPPDPACADGMLCEENPIYRVEHGPVLLQGFQGFIGQTNAFLWGKRHYPDLCEDGMTICTSDADCVGIGLTETCSLVDNGGISGIVFYAVTRAENNPELAAAEPWEPGIPGVTVNLYESLGRDSGTGVALKGALLNTTTTDSWDASIPTGCKYGDETAPFSWSPDGNVFYETDCFDGLRMFNQARPAVFDGGYAFTAVCEAGLNTEGGCDTEFFSPIPPGDYIVEVVAPPGYEILKPEDKNVDFGDEYIPLPELLPPPCVGELHLIPDYLALFPDQQIPAPYAGTERALCDSKLVTVSRGSNPPADFFLFTEVPIAAHGLGFILDDTQNEFDPNSPNFGEKYAPPFVPVTIRDWTGRVISKTLSDQYGLYNFLAPSTITANLPQPSGMSPNMLTTCMNDPGDDPNNPDPNWNQLYSTFCYTLQYMPGATTYLDTPIVPVAAFTGPNQFPLDCEFPDGTPRIYSVDVGTNGVGGGPYLPTTGTGNELSISGDQEILITSMGSVSVPNPNYCNPAAGACPAGADTDNSSISRDYGFGEATGTVTLGDLGTLPCTWSNIEILCSVVNSTPVGPYGGRQLTVTRADGQSTAIGVTVQVGLRTGSSVHNVSTSIQAAIDAAQSNDLILVQPGAYNEMVVMWKPVQLQGWGEGSTVINALNAPADKIQDWRLLVDSLIVSEDIDLLPGQGTGLAVPEPTQLATEEGAGVLVLAKAAGTSAFASQIPTDNRGARIDGFTIKSAITGGGIVVNGYGDYLDISNNRIANNSGFFGGGIRVGHPELVNGDSYTDSDNDHVSIHHNQVIFNGGLGGAGGGISMCTGSDSYVITENWVCGNFSQNDGGGVAHLGVSDRADTGSTYPLIEKNTIIFNESFFQGQTVSGGGLFISGGAPLGAGSLSPGAGNVRVLSNLIQGNSAGAGDGGGVRLSYINGEDVQELPESQWYGVFLYNNMIVDNVAGLGGGGISLQDAVNVRLVHNTIANNDSLATAGEAFSPGSPNQSTPQPGAGIISRAHSAALEAAGNVGTYSSPSIFSDNIIWHNRQFFFRVETGTPGDPAAPGIWGLCPDIGGTIEGLTCPGGNAPAYDDLGVLGITACLNPLNSILTDLNEDAPDCVYNGGSNNLASDPLFVAEYINGNKSSVSQPEVTTAIQAPPAFDEGGNFIRPRFGPLTLYNDAAPGDGNSGSLFGDYHIQSGSPAENAGSLITPPTDIDGDNRTSSPDIGADEIPEAVPGSTGSTTKSRIERREQTPVQQEPQATIQPNSIFEPGPDTLIETDPDGTISPDPEARFKRKSKKTIKPEATTENKPQRLKWKWSR